MHCDAGVRHEAAWRCVLGGCLLDRTQEHIRCRVAGVLLYIWRSLETKKQIAYISGVSVAAVFVVLYVGRLFRRKSHYAE